MLYLKTFETFEERNDLGYLAKSFLDEMAPQYDLRLGEEFDKEKANCAWFTKEFLNWAESEGYDFKVAYLICDDPQHHHTAPYKDGKIIDFTIKQFTNNPKDDYIISTPEDYEQYGYNEFEILDEVPSWFTIREADMIMEGYNKPRKGMKSRWSVKYKKKINCSSPNLGFSQKQYCKRKRRGGKYKS